MRNDADFPMGDRSRAYCRFCARPDGSMQGREEKLASLTAFLMRIQGLDEPTARETAAALMARLPAWSDGGR
jgi:hypothetical protein